MRLTEASRTAQDVASLRGLGPFLPPEARLVDDPWGAEWTGRVRLRRFAETAPAIARVLSRPGWRWLIYMQVRTFALDEVVRHFASSGGRQLLLLGAGLDARALRLRDLGLRVFEVDHPATHEKKQALVGKASTLVPWNLETDPLIRLPERLSTSGFVTAEPACVVWEGVTMYLSERAIDETFAMLHALLAPRSRVAFTYFDRAIIERPSVGARVLMRRVARIGEPWKFGWSPPVLPEWLAARGFKLESDDEAATLAQRFLNARYARCIRPDGRRVAVATPVT